ncbi:hypothetical protein HELRODRAFT_76005, partial [Helobdella robusta]|uniref:LRRNT domain-containing protein n=1 Tax=Helobdella robusta TaxID=6412 RepID=T1G2D9_HELRO
MVVVVVVVVVVTTISSSSSSSPSSSSSSFFSSSSSIFDDNCPRVCSCFAATVDCSNRQMTELPRDLPRVATRVNFAGNQLIVLASGSMTSLRNVVSLDLRRNELEVVADGVFEGCPILQVNAHFTTTLPPLPPSTNPIKQILDMSHNNLTNLNEFTFRGLETLTDFNLSNNLVGKMDGVFSSLVELSRLDISQNRIRVLTQFSLRDLVNLRELDMSETNLKYLSLNVVESMPNLFHLKISSNDWYCNSSMLWLKAWL